MARKRARQDRPERDGPVSGSEAAALPVVGLGASAGGLEALKAFFAAVRADSGMAYVVIMHLDPDRASNVSGLLESVAAIPVVEARQDVGLMPDHAYVVPPAHDLELRDGAIHLSDMRRDRRPLAIDIFFDSLARERGPLAAAIVLSGTGTDGSNGIRKIKDAEGLVLVQSTESASYPGMPSSALATGVVDLELDPGEMPAKLVQHFSRDAVVTGAHVEGEPSDEDARALSRAIAILRQKLGHDFSGHKESTLLRRLQRRMSLNEIDNPDAYIQRIREDQAEARALFGEFLIGVTHFFRDAAAFGFLRERVLPQLIEEIGDEGVLRAWVPGCSSGEEAFSLAMVIREAMAEAKSDTQLQIFATDLDERAIERARSGIFPATIAAEVQDERLQRFFRREGDFFRVRADIRDAIVFSVQDLLADPPFSRLDLVSCRNVLIYLKGEAQKRLIPLFHYTLNSGGVLMLGSSESISGFTTLFNTIDQKHKIFRRRDVSAAVRGQLQFPTGIGRRDREGSESGARPIESAGPGVAAITQQLLLERFAPTGVLIESDGTILHVQGRTGKWLEAVTGPPTSNILDLARSGLRLELASAVRTARSENEPVVRREVAVRTNGDIAVADVHVIPLREPRQVAGRLLVVLEEREEREHRAERWRPTADGTPGEMESRIADLEAELQKTRESHQSTVEELESANEELKSTNEELQSANEELQSTNEEHESSKEELQSLNEELHTTNSELESKINELQAANDDIQNVFKSTNIATIFVDQELRVRRFTREATEIVNLIETDIGRPLAHLSGTLDRDMPLADATAAIERLESVEKEVQTSSGVWYKLRVVPYRTADHRIDGAVLTFLNIDDQKKSQRELQRLNGENRQAWHMLRSVFDMNPEPLVVLDDAQRIVILNEAFAAAVGTESRPGERAGLESTPFVDLIADGTGEEIAQALSNASEGHADFHSGPVGFGSGKTFLLSGQIVRDSPELPYRILLRLEPAGNGERADG